MALSWSESDTDTSRPFPYVTTPPPARWCYPGMDEALCEAIWRLRLTQSEKSAREVHDELVREDRWSHLSLSDVKKTSSKMAKAGWQPPAETVPPQTDEPSQSDAPATVNPKKLVKWRGLGSPPMQKIFYMQKVGEQGLGPLAFAFSEAVPFGVKVALSTGRPTADIMPRSLWVHALASVANACEDKACYRVAVSEPTQREALLIDILSEPLTCPPDVPTNETEWNEQPSGAPAGTAERDRAVAHDPLPTHLTRRRGVSGAHGANIATWNDLHQS